MLHSQPHISLSKPPCKELCDVGLFVLKCSNVSDWKQSKDPHVLHSVSTGIYKTLYQSKTSALQCVYLLDDSAPSTGHSLTMAASSLLIPFFFFSLSIPDAHQQLPDHLWAKGKYDVGLIKNCEPINLVLAPKSPFRPCKAQYPLKQDAIEGISPVFN